MGRPAWAANMERIRQIRNEVSGNDAETLARLFEDDGILGGQDLRSRLAAILEATEHRWVQGFRTFADMPSLQECKHFSDRGFRPEFKDPWPCSRDQAGHFLTAVGLALYPEKLEDRRFFVRLRDWVGAPKNMDNEEVALRLIIGHEKLADPFNPDPLVLPKVRGQFASATDEDVAAFRRALEAVGADLRLDLARSEAYLAGIEVGQGRGNSKPDLLLSFAGYCLAQLIKAERFSDRYQVAAWIRQNLVDESGG